MWRAVPSNMLANMIFGVAGVSIALAYLITSIVSGQPNTLQSFWHVLSTGATIFGLFALIGNSETATRAIWRTPYLGTWLSRYIFPYIGGRWQGQLWSNYGVRLHNRLAGPISMEATTRCDLYRVRMHIKAPGSGANSHTVYVTLEKSPATDDLYLWYIYEQEMPQPEPTDERSHRGAARLRRGPIASAAIAHWPRIWRKPPRRRLSRFLQCGPPRSQG